MSATADYTMVAVKDGGLVDNPKGPGQLHRQYVTVKAPDGSETPDVYLRRKPENAASVGDTVYGTLKQTEQGWRLYPEQRDKGRENGRGGNVSKDDYWRRKDERDEAGVVRMGRAHSQEMALRALTLLGVPEMPQEHQVRELIKEWTDWFAADLNGAGAEVGGGGSSASAPADRGPVPAVDLSAKQSGGFASAKQKDFLERLLREAGGKDETVNAIVLYAEQTMSGERDGSISKAIDGLKEESTRQATAKRLAMGANEWASQAHEDLPADTRDLNPPAIADDESVPF